MEQQPNNASSSLAVRILSIVGGLLSALFLILFLAISDLARSNEALSFIAVFAIVGSIVGNRIFNQLFLDTAITAFYVTGCLALCYVMVDSKWSVHLICLILMLIAVLTFLLSKGNLFPLLAVLMFNVTITWFCMEGVERMELIQFPLLLMGTVFLVLNFYEAKIVTLHPSMNRLIRPLHTGFFLCFACGLIGISGIGYTFDKSVGILSVFIWVGIALMLRQIMKVMKVEKPEIEVGVYVACFAMLIPTLFAPSLSGALLLLLVCFGFGYKVEMGTSLVLLIYTIVKYYYDLQLTLLVKSGTLFFTGIVLLLVWYFFTKQTKKHEEI